MALDEVLLEGAILGEASLRFYQWREPTVSLGYFQPYAAAAGLAGLPLVRRPTGGDLLVHHHELTYTLALAALAARIASALSLAALAVRIASALALAATLVPAIASSLGAVPGGLVLHLDQVSARGAIRNPHRTNNQESAVH